MIHPGYCGLNRSCDISSVITTHPSCILQSIVQHGIAMVLEVLGMVIGRVLALAVSIGLVYVKHRQYGAHQQLSENC